MLQEYKYGQLQLVAAWLDLLDSLVAVWFVSHRMLEINKRL